MLAPFAEGALDPNECKELINHLADCSHCRQVASQLLLLSAESASMSPSIITAESSGTATSSAGWRTRSVVWMALAASLLLAVGLLLTRSGSDPQVAEARMYNSARKLLEDGQFDEARQLLSSSADKKIASCAA